jgi:hypothetical protein
MSYLQIAELAKAQNGGIGIDKNSIWHWTSCQYFPQRAKYAALRRAVVGVMTMRGEINEKLRERVKQVDHAYQAAGGALPIEAEEDNVAPALKELVGQPNDYERLEAVVTELLALLRRARRGREVGAHPMMRLVKNQGPC